MSLRETWDTNKKQRKKEKRKEKNCAVCTVQDSNPRPLQQLLPFKVNTRTNVTSDHKGAKMKQAAKINSRRVCVLLCGTKLNEFLTASVENPT